MSLLLLLQLHLLLLLPLHHPLSALAILCEVGMWRCSGYECENGGRGEGEGMQRRRVGNSNHGGA